MPDVRTPRQNRAIEKKQKIIKAGFELFCEKGYYATNTNDICRKAGVSTGALYSYFRDKKDIFIASFEDFLQGEYFSTLIKSLSEWEESFEVEAFIEKCIDALIRLYETSYKAINELSNMQIEDEEIMSNFCNFEDIFMEEVVKILKEHNIKAENLDEKFYLVFILSDALAAEKTFYRHASINYEMLKKETINLIANNLIIQE